VCLGELDVSIYHYRSFSPCIFNSIVNGLAMYCSQDGPCSEGYTHYLAAYDPSSDASILPIGISRDGRKIFGIHKADGTYWQPCDVDYCNGLYLNGEYVYVATYFFPYVPGCYGPANNGMLVPSCSTNPRVCLKSKDLVVSSLVLVYFVML